MQLSKNFSLAEMTVTTKPFPNVPNAKETAALKALAVNILQPLRDAVKRPITGSSYFRSAKVNAAVGGEASSQHRLGEAGDITIEGMTPKQVCRKIIELGLPFDQLICEFDRWTHVSYGPRNRRQVLTAVKRNGETVYLSGLQ